MLISYTLLLTILKFNQFKSMDKAQEECSIRFTLLFHAHCAQMQRINPDLGFLSTRTIATFTDFLHS